METGRGDRYKGKSLDEINIDPNDETADKDNELTALFFFLLGQN